HFKTKIILTSVMWYLKYNLSYRDLEEILNDLAINIDHSTIQRRVIKFPPIIERNFRRRKKLVSNHRKVDKT
ncbi:IS6 family transposase, partial [Bacteriovoracaceae bacterium]|nr:IS6 family transposase [Bacteriovoracaceae bacterium]